VEASAPLLLAGLQPQNYLVPDARRSE